jgi:hypothetical protein
MASPPKNELPPRSPGFRATAKPSEPQVDPAVVRQVAELLVQAAQSGEVLGEADLKDLPDPRDGVDVAKLHKTLIDASATITALWAAGSQGQAQAHASQVAHQVAVDLAPKAPKPDDENLDPAKLAAGVRR